MNENWDLTQGISEIQLLKEKVEALTEIVHNPNFVLIVRCRDCEYNGGDCERCLNPNLPIVGDDATYLAIDPDWYCGDGKRRKTDVRSCEPTEKQIAYATYLAQRMCVELPKENTKEAYSAFINKWKPAVAQEDQAMNEPSEWQLRYC